MEKKAERSPLVAMLLASVLGLLGLMGLGHLYLGRWGTGLAFLIGGFCCYVLILMFGLLGLLFSIFYYLYQVYDAYRTCKKEGLIKEGKPLSPKRGG